MRGRLAAVSLGRSGLRAHLILLGQLEAVVGFEALRVLRHVCDGDGRVAEHACGESRGRGQGERGAWPGGVGAG